MEAGCFLKKGNTLLRTLLGLSKKGAQERNDQGRKVVK
jgi:hypothetical protein